MKLPKPPDPFLLARYPNSNLAREVILLACAIAIPFCWLFWEGF